MSGGRNRNRGNNNQQNQNNNRNTQGGGQGSGRKKKRSRSKRQDPAVYWGDPEKLPDPEYFETETPDTLAIVRSLGRAPIPGTASEHYFTLMYDRAAQMAQLLGHAGGLDDMTPVFPEPDEDDEIDGNELESDAEIAVAEGDEPDDELRELDAAEELEAKGATGEEE